MLGLGHEEFEWKTHVDYMHYIHVYYKHYIYIYLYIYIYVYIILLKYIYIHVQLYTYHVIKLCMLCINLNQAAPSAHGPRDRPRPGDPPKKTMETLTRPWRVFTLPFAMGSVTKKNEDP